ncbi:hypothetical protein HD806DRAFT_509721 [Xylariaceae sp. AK1471]|nr:hypothetical protein HD806DRAFT_509721 [Xylariaceae sp. AK1471]
MPPEFLCSLSFKKIRAVQRSSQTKSTEPEDSEIAVPIVLGAIFVVVFTLLFFAMYRSWRWERAQALKKEQNEAKEEGLGRLEKAELSAGSSVMINEMDSQCEGQELPGTKEGLPHELPEANIVPQELPAASLHEMSAECDNNQNEKAWQSTEAALILENTEGHESSPGEQNPAGN